MDESPKRVGSDDAKEPEDKQNDEDCPKHVIPISQEARVYSACVAPGEGFGEFLEDSIVDNWRPGVCPLRHTFDYFGRASIDGVAAGSSKVLLATCSRAIPRTSWARTTRRFGAGPT
jgi:hypothetical protein